MRNQTRLHPFILILLSACIACVVSTPAFAEGADKGPASSKPSPAREKKTFTNDDLEELASRGGITTFLLAPRGAAQESAAEPGEGVAKSKPYIKEEDPLWYMKQSSSLNAKLYNIESEVQRLRAYRETGITAGMNVGLVLARPSEGITTDNKIEQLLLRRGVVEQQIGDLEDTARRNGFPPGLLREAPPPEQPPQEARPMTPEQAREAWGKKVQPVKDQLLQVQGEIARMRQEAAARGMTLFSATEYGGGFTADLLERLGSRANELQSKMNTIEDDAHRAGVPPGWLR